MTNLDRCAALIEKIKRGPEWADNASTRTFGLRPPSDGDSRWCIKSPIGTVWYYEHFVSDHEAACILEKWLRGELRDAGYGVSAWPDGTVNVWRQKHGESLCIVCNSNELTALIETAEKVLL